MDYKQIKIDITKGQLDKAIKGKSISIKKDQIGRGDKFLSLHPANVKIVEKAAVKDTGCVLSLSPGELLATAENMKGSGIFGDIFKGLKSGYNWTKSNVIETPFYQKGIKPVVRDFVDRGQALATAIVPQAGPALQMGKDYLSKETGAFGVKSRRTKAQKKSILQGRGLYLS